MESPKPSTAASDPAPRKYTGMDCRFCQRSFSKGEHLRRHERSHTGSRPFICKDCGRPFARQDSLARHERLHTRREINYPSPPSSMISQSSIPSILPVVDTNLQVETPKSQQGIMNNSGASHSIIGITPSSTEDIDFELMWPDSEDLFETLMSSDPMIPWQMPIGILPVPITTRSHVNNGSFGIPGPFQQKGSIGSIPVGESHQAVHNVSEMVTSLSSTVTAAVEATSLTSVFLDECLHMFFVRFIPTFPVLHRSTFVFRECTQPLLLNAMAIGSLYLGPKDSVAKGEALWRLAHVAVATSWETLITHKGPYDSCQGVQLVVTALLAQIYGALSRNRVIRTTSQAFHALGFFWARQCAISDSEPYSRSNLPSQNSTDEEKDRAWKFWAAKEIKQRALLGHYVLDGLISRMSGETPSVRHAANQLGLPSSETAFEARTASEWLNHMRSQEPSQYSFRSIIRSLFDPTNQPLTSFHAFSAFSLRVILEGLQSLVSDCDSDDLSTVGVPTKLESRKALSHVFEAISISSNLSHSERLELLLRWHTICLDTCKDSSLLCRSICSRYGIVQHVCGGKNIMKPEQDLISWAGTEEARKALVHAIAIQEIVEQLPRGRAHVIHIPSSLFASATVYCVFSLAGQGAVSVPNVVDWQAVLATNDLGESSIQSTCSSHSETQLFLRGGNSAFRGLGTTKNLLYELNSMQKLFKCLCSQWGIAFDMEDVLDQWNTLCH
ncbi:19ce0469-3f0d-4b0a-ab2f-1b3d6aa9e17d [Sclerotinia trifoliorum]|uniref:19ce0469-3f0d-4b0a-ab2f-1b3d6aa9e17d n=1 Tax=Sclerotinia trifoliorum TaxID=28548 RepID=A0A8H2W157_9HELO|nr:19ce0469-3f0d-4b0a-ab2f-1b3d6aa9e17d [Sclerotinia trifoliorum]